LPDDQTGSDFVHCFDDCRRRREHRRLSGLSPFRLCETPGPLVAKYCSACLRVRGRDLPIEQVNVLLRFIINLKTARAIGLAIPSSVLRRLDEAIE